jgi:nitroreductase
MTSSNTLGLSVDEVLTTTRTVRKRLDVTRPVSREVLKECLEIALQAPNGSNLNRWRWIVVDDPEMVAKIAAEYRKAVNWPPAGEGGADETGNATAIYKRVERGEKILDSAYALAEKFDRLPAIVVPLMRGRTDGMDVFNQSGMWGSIYPAIWSFCLAAREHGLGTAWTTASCMREREVCEVLGIPVDKFTHIGLLPVAYYEGDSFRKAWRKPLDDVLTWNSFEG